MYKAQEYFLRTSEVFRNEAKHSIFSVESSKTKEKTEK